MTRRRVTDEAIARLVIRRRGRKGLKGADLAALLGATPPHMYQSIRGTLRVFARSCVLHMQGAKGSPRYGPFPSSPVFTLSGVIAVTGVYYAQFRDKRALEIGVDAALTLRQRGRSSATKKRVRRKSGAGPRSPARQRADKHLHDVYEEMQKYLSS